MRSHVPKIGDSPKQRQQILVILRSNRKSDSFVGGICPTAQNVQGLRLVVHHGKNGHGSHSYDANPEYSILAYNILYTYYKLNHFLCSASFGLPRHLRCWYLCKNKPQKKQQVGWKGICSTPKDPCIVYLPTFTIKIDHSCRYKYTIHRSYGNCPFRRPFVKPCVLLGEPGKTPGSRIILGLHVVWLAFFWSKDERTVWSAYVSMGGILVKGWEHIM